jgi:hypothetical protein
MKLSMVVATVLAGVLLAGAFTDDADGGWFGLGGSSKSSQAAKSPKNDFYNPNLVASGATASSSANKTSTGGIGSLFGLGKPSSTSQSSKKKPVSSVPKSKATDKSQDSSWWSSWFKPKQPPPPKNTQEWMNLKPVRW